MKSCFTLLFVMVWGATAALAEQRLEMNMQASSDQSEEFQLDGKTFYFADTHGFYESVEGPAGDGMTRCLGSGFYHPDGTNDIKGICIFGEEADTFTMTWVSGEQGGANAWEIVSGTGKFLGATGQGISTRRAERLLKAMPFTHIHVVGTIDLPKK